MYNIALENGSKGIRLGGTQKFWAMAQNKGFRWYKNKEEPLKAAKCQIRSN